MIVRVISRFATLRNAAGARRVSVVVFAREMQPIGDAG
jgi:hypothetical protein